MNHRSAICWRHFEPNSATASHRRTFHCVDCYPSRFRKYTMFAPSGLHLLPPRARLFSASATGSTNRGALLNLDVFSHVFGTKGKSEPILKGLLSAWSSEVSTADEAELDLPTLSVFANRYTWPNPKEYPGTVFIEVRDTEGDSNVIALQRYRNRFYATEMFRRVAVDAIPSTLGIKAQALQMLAICDEDGAEGEENEGGPIESWRIHQMNEVSARVFPDFVPDPEQNRAVQRNKVTLMFASKMPKPDELGEDATPLMKWGSIICHLKPGVPIGRLGGMEGIGELFEMVNDEETKRFLQEEIDFVKNVEGAVPGTV